MNTTNDRMGGFVSAKIVEVKQIEAFLVTGRYVRLVYKDTYLPTSLDIVKNGVDPNVTSSLAKSGEIFAISISIEIKELVYLKYKSFNKYLVILELPTGEHHVFGTPEHSLTITSHPVYDKTPRGRMGGMVNIVGKQPHNILIMQ